MKRTLTTIIPFYNCMNAMPRMLDSILSGTVLPDELILIDDGSDDGSLNAAKSYAQKHSFVKVLSQSHAGVSAARNLGIKNATGYWISFLDADDFVEPDMYEKMLESVEASSGSSSEEDCPFDGCLCGYYTHKDGQVTPYSYGDSKTLSSDDMLKLMFTDDSVRGFLFTRLFRADLLKELSFDQNIRLCEDLFFQTRLFATKSVKFACLPKPMYHYIQDQASATVTRSFFDGDTFIYRPAYDRIREYYSEDCVLGSYNAILDYSMYTLLNQYKACRDSQTKNQIRLLQREMRRTKTPLARKSKRRIAYELGLPSFMYIL